MIISASRRTDIPAYYSSWFLNRIKDGFVYVRNPMNYHRISKISLSPDVVDGIVFWTKNPTPMLARLDELKEYPFYFQFTLTAYANDVEVSRPSKNDVLIPAFQRLADKIGPERVIWRYDPILINKTYTKDCHIEYFEKLAKRLAGYTGKCTISFIDMYRNTVSHAREMELTEVSEQCQNEMAKALADIAHGYGLCMEACAEPIDFSQYGIGRARCIDDTLLQSISGYPLKIEKDRNQRKECGCVSSIDIGMYNTCKNGCRYCYANYNEKMVQSLWLAHDVHSPLISGHVNADDVVTERKVVSNKDSQISFLEGLD